jgi:hypothetical protein
MKLQRQFLSAILVSALAFPRCASHAPTTQTPQSPLETPSVAQQPPASPEPQMYSAQGKVVILALQSANRTRLVLAVNGKNGEKRIEFLMNDHSHATPGLKLGVTATVAYHDQKGVHLVSLVRVHALPSAPVEPDLTSPSGPSAQPNPASKQNGITPLSSRQGAVAQNIPPGVFEKDLRPLNYQNLSALIGVTTGITSGAAKGAGASSGSAAASASPPSAQKGKIPDVTTTASSSSGGDGLITVRGKVISWGPEYLLLDTKTNGDTHHSFQVFITEDTAFQKDVSLNDEVAVTYKRKKGEKNALSILSVNPPKANEQ